MSIVGLTPKFVFGISGQFKNNIFFLDEQTILYPAGSNVVLYNIEQKSQKFALVGESCSVIQSCAMSFDRRFLAVGVKSEESVVVSIIDVTTLRRRKVLVLDDVKPEEFTHLAFSNDGKFLVAISNEPNQTLFYWNWEKNRLLCCQRLVLPANGTVNGVSFHPEDVNQICIIGAGFCRIYRFMDGGFKTANVHRQDFKTFTSHFWLDNSNILLGTNDGKFFVSDNGDIKPEFIENENNQDLFQINIVVPYGTGFICGDANGAISLYEKVQDQDMYRRIKDIHTNDQHVGIRAIALSATEEILAVTLNNNQIFGFSLVASDSQKDNTSSAPLFSFPYHHGSIISLDTCPRKPIVVTCSTDRSVRVWNYLENSCIFVKYYPEELYSVAIHPSSFYILVGFNDKLRLFSFLLDELKLVREFQVRGCKECHFSNGGQFFAAANGNTVHIYSTWTYEMLNILKGHIGKVKSIFWYHNDQRLVTSGVDGAVYEWDVNEGRRKSENVLKSCSYFGAVMERHSNRIFAVGNDNVFRILEDGQISNDLQMNQQLTRLTYNQIGNIVIAGSKTGFLRVFRYPIDANKFDFHDHALHSSPITDIKIAFDNSHVISVGEDGCIYVSTITEKERLGKKLNEPEYPFATEILITKAEMDDKITTIVDLRSRVEELKMENEYQMRLKELTYKEKLHETQDRLQKDIDSLKIVSGSLRSEKEQLVLRHSEDLSEINENHQQQIKDMETANNEKLLTEYEKFAVLQQKMESMQTKWEEKSKEIRQLHELRMKDISEDYEQKISRKEEEITELRNEMHRQIKEFEFTLKETEEDADLEILGVQEKYEVRLRQEQDVGSRIKGENSLLRKKFNSLQKEISDHKNEIQRMSDNERKLHNHIKQIEKDSLNLKKEIQERDETIVDKEKRIYDLRKKNQELEKFKFVLDHKILEMKKQIEPREETIAVLTKQIKDMDVEIQKYYSENSRLERCNDENKLRYKTMEKELYAARGKLKRSDVFSMRLQDELHRAVMFAHDAKEFQKEILEVYRKFCKEPEKFDLEKTEEKAIIEEYNKQRIFLEKTVEGLRNQLRKVDLEKKSEKLHMLSENTTLLKELSKVKKQSIQQAKLEKQARLKKIVDHKEEGTKELNDLHHS